MADSYLQFSFVVSVAPASKERAWLNDRLQVLRRKREALGEGLGFSYEFEGTQIWFYAEDYGDPDVLVAFLYDFLKKFHPDGNEAIAFTWSLTCSKLRLNEFTGGGVCVTAKGATWINADHVYTLARETREAAPAKTRTSTASRNRRSKRKSKRT